MSKLLEYFNGDDLAASVWEGKYAAPGEKTPDDMHKRLAKEFARIDNKFYDEGKAIVNDSSIYARLSKYGKGITRLSERRIYNYFKDFKYIVPQGSIMAMLGRDDKIGSLSNCFVVGQPADSYGGILQKDQQLAQLMKRRGGVGIDISSLRPAGANVTNAAGSSTGAASFMHRYSNTTREVAQAGRRGALMITIDCRHPDVFDFVNAKSDRTSVTGANISVMLRDDFMQAVENDEDYLLRFPCDMQMEGDEVENYVLSYGELFQFDTHKFVKRIKAKELYDQIVWNAWDNAEPGQMFVDRHWNYSPDGVYSGAYANYRGVTTNPCGEIFMGEYDACRLIALNLFNVIDNPFTSEAKLNEKKLYEIAYEGQRLSDDLVELELEHIDRILNKIKNDKEESEVRLAEYDLWKRVRNVCKSSRRTGLGITALGDTLAGLGVTYTSSSGMEYIHTIMGIIFRASLDSTVDMALLRGPFKGHQSKKEFSYTEEVVPGDGEKKLIIQGGKNDFFQFILEEFPDLAERLILWGRRNVSWLTIAPTGSLSLLTQTTSGCEPLFAWGHTRRKKVNPGDQGVRVDFVDESGDSWMEYPVFHPKFKDWINIIRPKDVFDNTNLSKEDAEELFLKSPWAGSTADEIDWVKRVEVQSILQKYITHSISSTINLPKTATVEEVAKIYLESWRQGLKGVTVYRDGSRSGVLIKEREEEKLFKHNDAPKRPVSLECDVYHTTTGGNKYTIFVGLLEASPYEVFIIPGTRGKIGHDSFLTKIHSGEYQLEVQNGTERIYSDITENMTDEQVVISRLISTSLRHGANIKYIVEQLGKSHGDLFSFTKSIARTLKKYIPDGELSTAKCLDCGGSNVVYQEGCQTCMDCGSSKCG